MDQDRRKQLLANAERVADMLSGVYNMMIGNVTSQPNNLSELDKANTMGVVAILARWHEARRDAENAVEHLRKRSEKRLPYGLGMAANLALRAGETMETVCQFLAGFPGAARLLGFMREDWDTGELRPSTSPASYAKWVRDFANELRAELPEDWERWEPFTPIPGFDDTEHPVNL